MARCHVTRKGFQQLKHVVTEGHGWRIRSNACNQVITMTIYSSVRAGGGHGGSSERYLVSFPKPPRHEGEGATTLNPCPWEGELS